MGLIERILLFGWMLLISSMMEVPLVVGQATDLSSELKDLQESVQISTPSPLVDTHHIEGPSGKYSLNFTAAIKMCQILGAKIASYDELKAAWTQGLDVCRAGWLRDGSVRYPLVNPTAGCGKHNISQIVSYGNRPHEELYDVYCSKEIGSGSNDVLDTGFLTFHAEGPRGRYTLNFDAAVKLCQMLSGHLSSFGELETAWKKGLDVCRAGWLADGSVRYPLNNHESPKSHCGHTNASIIVSYGNRSHEETYDAYCTLDVDPFDKGSGDGSIELSFSGSGSGSGDGVSDDFLVEELHQELDKGSLDDIGETTGSAGELSVTEITEIVEIEYVTERTTVIFEESEIFSESYTEIKQPSQDDGTTADDKGIDDSSTTPYVATTKETPIETTTASQPKTTTIALPCSYRPGLIQCAGSEDCIPANRVCDGVKNCPNGDDEKSCGQCLDLEGKKRLLRPDEICDGVKDCQNDYDEDLLRCLKPCRKGFKKCEDKLQCLHENLFCDGIPQCRDLSDEDGCDKKMEECATMDQFSCDGVCKPMSALCDRTYDCSDKTDEKGCNYKDNSIVICPNSYYRITDQENGGKTKCIHKTMMESEVISNNIKEELEDIFKNPA